jgi:urease accessory protein
MKKTLMALAGLATVVLAAPAFAHSSLPGHTHGLTNGLLHPVGGLDHVLAMLGVGLWSVLAMPRHQVWLAPFAFVAAMLGGGGAGIAGLPLFAVEAGIALSVVAIGVMIAARAKVPAALAAILIGAFGAMHGYAHGVEAEGGILAYMAGFTLTTAALHLTGIGLGQQLAGLRTATSLAGGAMAIAGVSLLVA